MELAFSDCVYLGYYLEGFLFGLYSGIFFIYLQNHVSQRSTDRGKNIRIFYALCLLYALSAATIMLVMLSSIWINGNIGKLYHFIIIEGTISACCDFIAQSILIYRCYIVWNCNIYVVIPPSILALAFLAIFITTGSFSPFVVQGQLAFPDWARILIVTGLALSMIVNALVTGLIVFKILRVFRELKANTVNDQILQATGRSPLQRVMFVLVESGMVLFAMHFARLVIQGINVPTDAGNKAYQLITSIQDIVNGITPTIILMRVSMGWSFHDRSSMEASIGSLHFAPDDPNSIPEIGDANIVDDERRLGDDDIEFQLNNDSGYIDGRELDFGDKGQQPGNSIVN